MQLVLLGGDMLCTYKRLYLVEVLLNPGRNVVRIMIGFIKLFVAVGIRLPSDIQS